jgi:hypothetical protein
MNRSLPGLLHLAFLALLACGGSSAARPEAASANETSGAPIAGGWEKLGERTVHGRVDRDVIHVGRHEGRFSAIQIKVDGNTVEMFDIVVTFGDGERFEPATRLFFDKNTTSRVIDLPGQKRVIERVEFKYGKLPGEGHAAVELWARAA